MAVNREISSIKVSELHSENVTVNYKFVASREKRLME